MNKPNIIDEIIQCLKLLKDVDTSMDQDVLLEFINDSIPKHNSESVAQVSVSDMPEWDALRDECSKCMLCSLGRTRTCRTFAEGNPHAELMFIRDHFPDTHRPTAIEAMPSIIPRKAATRPQR